MSEKQMPVKGNGERPNILFITAEDICPNLGCYGDPNATTPYLDSFASEGIRFTNVYSVHPCCSPSRSCLATGMYPTRQGGFQHRAKMWVSSNEVRTVTSLLRDEGYYTFNGMEGGSYKTDYNFEPTDDPWDTIRSEEVEWRNRPAGKPFFGQVNLFRTHQSQYGRRLVGEADPHRTHDPGAIILPPYHPDTPAVREIWAEYHDRITEMDEQFSRILGFLEEDGLQNDTIVIFLGDNGMGIPGGKVWLWEQGLHVPLIIRIPKKWHSLYQLEQSTAGVTGPHEITAQEPGFTAIGKVCSKMVSFVDFAPTLLSLCGIPIPGAMTGQPFLGPHARERDFCFAARDFHDGADFDTSRVVRSRRFHYIRNFMPHQGWDPILYSWSRAPYMLTEWLNAAERGELDCNMRQIAFFSTEKPPEELYDIINDPHCLNNLATDPGYHDMLLEMGQLCRDWMIETGDLGMISQYELYSRSEGAGTPYALSGNREKNPVEALINAADMANYPDNNIEDLKNLLKHDESTLRRWGAIGLLASGSLSGAILSDLIATLDDSAPDVRLSAAEALCRHGLTSAPLDTIKSLLTFPDGIIRREALYVLVRIGQAARPLLPFVDQALEPCLHRDIWSGDNVAEAVTLLKACLGVPPVDDDSMIPYKLTRTKKF
jgi:N-sulfoglucosamine sulfohydrolase